MFCETSDTLHDWRFVHAQLRSIALRRAALDAEEARWLREAVRLEIWRELGHPTMLSYIEQTLGFGPRAAQDRLRVAHALVELPVLERALSTGAVSYSAVRELTRVASPETENDWLIAAADKNLRQVEELVAGHLPGDRPTDPARVDVDPRSVHYDVRPETFALARQVRKVMQDECGHALDDDAFLNALCRRALETPNEGGTSRALHQIAITVCDGCGRGWQDGAGAVVEIDERAVDKAFCDAEQIGSLDADEPERAAQDIPPAMRRLIERRDHLRCQVPGCRSARNLDIHHIVMRARGGSHEASNLILCCSAHHDAVHDGLLTIAGSAPDKLVFTNRRQPARADTSIVDVARDALVRLGFRKREATEMVEAARAHVGAASLEVLIKEALRRMP